MEKSNVLLKLKKIRNNIGEKIKNIQNIENNKNNIFMVIIFIIYMLIILLISYYHEAWEDEAQSWLIARDLDFLDIIKQMRFEGHSFFWHFLLVIFAKNMPFEFSKIIMIAISGITGILILKKAPYRNIFKILILFNPVFLYYMPVLLRPYALIPLMLILISIMNERPEKYPVLYGIAIAILANTHIIMLGFAASIYFFFFKQQFLEKYKENSKKQNRRLIIGAIFASLGIVIVLSCAVLGYFFSTAPTHGTDIPEELCQRIVDFSRNLFLQIVGIEISKFVILLINLIILVIILIQALKIDKKQGIIFFIGLTFYLFVQIFLFGIFISQRTVLIFIFLLYFSWNTKKNCMKKNKIDVLEIIIFFICLLSIPNSVRLVSDEIKYPYSDSKNTAKYIEENIDPENSVILTVNWDTISAVEVYLSGKNYKFYDATGKEYMTFATWNKFLDSKKEMYLEDALKEFENSDKKLYLLNFISDGYKIEAWKYFNKSKDKLKPIYITKEKCITRKAYLYKIEN